MSIPANSNVASVGSAAAAAVAAYTQGTSMTAPSLIALGQSVAAGADAFASIADLGRETGVAIETHPANQPPSLWDSLLSGLSTDLNQLGSSLADAIHLPVDVLTNKDGIDNLQIDPVTGQVQPFSDQLISRALSASTWMIGGDILVGHAAHDAIVGGVAVDAAVAVDPRLIGSYTPSPGLIFGTTSFGQEAHAASALMIKDNLAAQGVTGIIDRTEPGAKGIDLSLPDRAASELGFAHIEIKPDTISGMKSFDRAIGKWGYDPSTVQAATYDQFGNIRWGFTP
jgi:hypothetical protein